MAFSGNRELRRLFCLFVAVISITSVEVKNGVLLTLYLLLSLIFVFPSRRSDEAVKHAGQWVLFGLHLALATLVKVADRPLQPHMGIFHTPCRRRSIGPLPPCFPVFSVLLHKCTSTHKLVFRKNKFVRAAPSDLSPFPPSLPFPLSSGSRIMGQNVRAKCEKFRKQPTRRANRLQLSRPPQCYELYCGRLLKKSGLLHLYYSNNSVLIR